MYNKTLLEDGVANLATYPPNVKYVEDFTAIVNARNNLFNAEPSNPPDILPNQTEINSPDANQPSVPEIGVGPIYSQTDTVYVSKRSNTIHSVPDCGGMKNYREMTRSDADAKGYKYCPNCW